MKEEDPKLIIDWELQDLILDKVGSYCLAVLASLTLDLSRLGTFLVATPSLGSLMVDLVLLVLFEVVAAARIVDEDY
jgi:hypothetical protein